ncbi:MAG: histidinol-phosphatase HisJ family protein [Clostridiales bacterium]|nr:histidinol-phosphatase HisJ family protein [Clostridiales bacterium]
MFVDYHVHTYYSDDSVYPMNDVIKDAVQMGMDELCITDHVDYGVKEDWDCGKEIAYRNSEPLANVDYPKFMAELAEMKRRYEEQIVIRTGVEFGAQLHTIPLYERLFRKYPFDFIILSVHQVEDKEFWTQEFQKGKTQRQYNERYYEEMLRLVKQYKNYSVLGHMDLIARYDRMGPYPFEKVKPMIAEILKIVISDGKGIELNTSWHRYGLKDTTPSTQILKLYRELGGEILTLGSDSHAPGQLGAFIQEDSRRLRDLGFRYFCTYEAMVPTFHPL